MEIVSDKKGFELEKELIGKCNSKVKDNFFRKDDSSIIQEITPFLDDTSLIDLNGELSKDSFVHASLFASATIRDLGKEGFYNSLLIDDMGKNDFNRSLYISNSLFDTADLTKQISALEKVKDFLDKNDSENLSDARVLVKTAIEKIGKEIKDLEKASLELDEPMNLPSSLPKINNSTFGDSFSL